MDSKVMGLIDAAVSKLPRKSANKNARERQYVNGKYKLIRMFPGEKEHDYICQKVADKYGT